VPHHGISRPCSNVPYSYDLNLGVLTVSIIKTRELLEKRGCGSCIGIAIGIVFLLGIAFTGQRGGCAKDAGPNGQPVKFTIAEVADTKIELAAFDALTKRTAKMFFGDENALSTQPVEMKINLYSSILEEMIQKARVVGQGKKLGIEISDEDLAKRIDADLDKMIEMQYSMYVKQQPKGKAVSFDEFKKSPSAIQLKAQYRPLVAPFEEGDNVYFTKATYIDQEIKKKLAGGKNPETLKPAESAKLATEYQAKIKEAEKDFPIKWNDPGFELLYTYKTAAKDYKTLKPLVDKAKELAQDVSKVKDTGLIKQIRYVLLDDAWKSATPEQKKEITEERASAIEDVLLTTEDFNLRMQLVDLYREAKLPAKVLEHLMAASGNNVKYDATGKKCYDDVEKKLKELVDAKVLDDASAKLVKDSQARWLDGKAEQEKLEKEAKQVEAERDKEKAEEAKKFAEDKKKFEAEQAKKKGSAPSEKKPASSGKESAPSEKKPASK